MSVPRDAALPRLRLLLDREAMAPVLQSSLERSAQLDSVRIARVSYKPGERVTVHYEVLVDMHAENAVARDVRGHDLETVTWLPFDPRLPALAKLPGKPRLLSYKPRRRVVMRVNGHVFKAYASSQQFQAAAKALRTAHLVPGASTPAFEGVDAPLQMTVQSAVDGKLVSGVEAAAEAGALLRELQRAVIAGLELPPPERQMKASARRKAELIATVAPRLASRVRTLMARLEAIEPSGLRLAPAHGDFHAGQLLRANGELWVLDVDSMCMAPPALDIAEYAAEASADSGVVDALLDGYGDRPEGLEWHLAAALLIRASHPFHKQDPEWPERVEATLEIAEGVL
jgi:thiamine kinase-like enzyme